MAIVQTEIINEMWRSSDEIVNYQVSNIGRVRNADTGRILKQSVNTQGYFKVDLYKDGKRTQILVHRLVAQEFIENLDDLKCVDHIDHCRQNNQASNIRWCSLQQNNMNKAKKLSPSTSKYKGVTYNKKAQKMESVYPD